MERFIKDSSALLVLRQGLLGPYVDLLASELSAEGYAEYTGWLHLKVVGGFSQWLKQNRIAIGEITWEHAVRYLRYRSKKHERGRCDGAALKRMLDILRKEGVIACEVSHLVHTAVDQELERFVVYLQQERGLVARTIIYYREFASRFLVNRFSSGQVDLSQLCSADVVDFIQRQASCLRIKQAKLMTTALRSFLRYVQYQGYIATDLAAAVPSVAGWSRTDIPRGMPADQVELVLASCNRDTATGRRDYAILLLLARLGLRAGEVISLKLANIDWKAGCITIRGKGGQWSQLPLPIDVGEAVVAYLQGGRQQTNNRSLFLRTRAPIAGLKNSTSVARIVEAAMKRSDIKSPRTGAHQFRHGLATKMLAQGSSLAEIGELLRHSNQETTTIYAKVDLIALRTLALPWPGGRQ